MVCPGMLDKLFNTVIKVGVLDTTLQLLHENIPRLTESTLVLTLVAVS